jgi:DNA-binding NtrC family response regulator
MPDMGGLEVLAKLRPTNPDLPIIVLTAKGGIDSAVEAIRAGANDFLVKPASPERIAVSIRNQLKIGTLSGEVKQLKKKTDNKLTFDDLIARAIQGTSSRAGKPFVTVNCGAIPENLIESILFGHEKGCFTGASDKHLGKFQEADGGTLFLDEIGELRLDMQVKLLRALQEGEVDPVGSKRPVKVDVRIISATNRDLGQMAREGGFREDLYYRLNVFSIMVPSLRDRASDIAPLAQHFIARFAAEENKAVVGLTQEAAALLESFSWPGNVRQLENTIFRAVVLCDGSLLDVCDFPQIASAMGVEASHRNAFATQAAPVSHGNQGAPALPTGSPYALSATDASGHIRKFEELESEIIRMSIARYDGHMSEVARRLGIGRSTLYRKLKEFGLEPAEDGASEESAIEEAMRKAG